MAYKKYKFTIWIEVVVTSFYVLCYLYIYQKINKQQEN